LQANIHLLVVPKPSYLAIQAVTDLRKEHLVKVQKLHQLGRRVAETVGSGLGEGNKIRLGYHSIPSLTPLHLHIISQDFDSPALKTKKHWNSFTTPFFLDASAVESRLENHGRVHVDHIKCVAYEKQDLHCHRCHKQQKNMPELKNHIRVCKAPVP